MNKKPIEKTISFDSNGHLPQLFGFQDQHLKHIEKTLGVVLTSRGNVVLVKGVPEKIKLVEAALSELVARLDRGLDVSMPDVEAAIRMLTSTDPQGSNGAAADVQIVTKKKIITPRSHNQRHYMGGLCESDITFGVGPAGTGKTYIAVAAAVEALLEGKAERVLLSRPAIEAGERLGFLPGDLKEKIDPYLRPLYDALYDMLPADQVTKRLQTGEIEIAPLAYMRGRTLSNAYIILDEAQNTTSVQMKMFLTRLGENAKMVVTGDPSQVDLPTAQMSGLVEAMRRLQNVKGIHFTLFDEQDVVRHHLVAKIIQAYDKPFSSYVS